MKDREQWLRWIYSVPNPFDSEEAGKRHRHEDLESMSPAELRREIERLRDRLIHDDSPHDWLCERLDRLEAEVDE